MAFSGLMGKGLTPLPSIELVVARYLEDVSWLGKAGLPFRIYDKGDSLSGPTVERLPNVGRESHSYFVHIVRRWESLADYTVFLQGNPFPHLGEAGDPVKLRSLILQTVERRVPFKGLAWFRMRCDKLGRPHDMADPATRGRWKGWGRDIPVGFVFETLFHRPSPDAFIASAPAGLLLVSRDRILARPVEFYLRAIALLEADPDDAQNTGHAIERLWQVIFNGQAGLNP